VAGKIAGARTASQIISTVTVLAADQPGTVAVALAVVSDTLKHPVGSSTRCSIRAAALTLDRQWIPDRE